MKVLLLLISLSCFSQIRKDLVYHTLAGGITAYTGYKLTYKITKNKWVSRGSGLLLGWGIGYAKEYIWDASGRGNVNKKDFLYTGLGATIVTISIEHKKK